MNAPSLKVVQDLLDLAKSCNGKEWSKLSREEKHAVLLFGHIAPVAPDVNGRIRQSPKGKVTMLLPNKRLADASFRQLGMYETLKKLSQDSYHVYLDEDLTHDFKEASLGVALTDFFLLPESAQDNYSDLPHHIKESEEIDYQKAKQELTRTLMDITFHTIYKKEPLPEFIKFIVKEFQTYDHEWPEASLLLPGFDVNKIHSLEIPEDFKKTRVNPKDHHVIFKSPVANVVFWARRGVYLNVKMFEKS